VTAPRVEGILAAFYPVMCRLIFADVGVCGHNAQVAANVAVGLLFRCTKIRNENLSGKYFSSTKAVAA
jgi:hypothetical protein